MNVYWRMRQQKTSVYHIVPEMRSFLCCKLQIQSRILFDPKHFYYIFYNRVDNTQNYVLNMFFNYAYIVYVYMSKYFNLSRLYFNKSGDMF